MTDYIATNDPFVLGGVKDETAGRFDADFADHATSITTTNRISLFGLNEVWVQFDFYLIGAGTSSDDGRFFYVSDANSRAYIGLRQTNGVVDAFRETRQPTNGFPVLSVSAAPVARETLHRADVRIIKDRDLDQISVTYEFYLNGALLFSYSGESYTDDPLDADWTLEDFFTYGGYNIMNGGSGLAISNLRVSDTSTIGRKFRAISLNAAGNYSGFVNFPEVLTDPVLGAYSDAAAERFSGTIDFASLTDNGAPAAVTLQARVRPDGILANPNRLAFFIREGTTDYDGTPQAAPSSAYQFITARYLTNPATASAWAHADLDGMEFGLVSSHV